MRFENPLFLFALAAIAIPILIHLFNFRKFKKIYFSNIKFLKAVQLQTQHQSKLKHLLVLLARILAISCLVAAFAQPYIPSGITNINNGDKAISIYIDNSFSMEAINKNGSLLNETKKRAREIIDTYKPSDRFQLLTNDFEGKHQRLLSKEDFIESLDEVKISPSIKDISEVVARQMDVLTKSNANKRIAYLLSDFQKSTTTIHKLKKDTSADFLLIPVEAQEKDNVFVDSCWFSKPVNQINQLQEVHVRIRNLSDKVIENNPIKLFLNGQQKTPASYSIEAQAGNTIVLSFVTKQAGIQQCRVEITDYPITFDDIFYFSFDVAHAIPILTIASPTDDKTETSSVISIKRVYTDSLFVLNSVEENKLDYSALKSNKLIIINELQTISSGMVQELKRFVTNGGSLLIFPHPTANIESYNMLLSSLNTNIYLPLDTVNTRVDKINTEHELFNDVFDKKNERIDLPYVLAHYPITKNSRSTEEYLFKLQNNDVFMAKYSLGNGKIYLSAVPLNKSFSNFTQHAMFVATLYKIAIMSQPKLPLFYTISDNTSFTIDNIAPKGDHTFHIKGNANFDVIPEHKVINNTTGIYIHNQLKQPGNYLLHLADSIISGLSFNIDRKESDLNCYTPKSLETHLASSGLDNYKVIELDAKSLTDTLAGIAQGKKLWKVFIILALLFLATEIILIRFLK